MVLRVIAVAAMLALATPTLAVAQGNTQQQPGGGKPQSGARPPGGGANPAFRPAGPPGGTPGFVAPHPGPRPGSVAAPPPPQFAPRQPGFVAAPPAPVIAPSQPGFVAAPPAIPAAPQIGGPAVATQQFTWHGRTFQRAHAPRFVYPNGFGYQRWAVGAILPPLFLAPVYFYPDWVALGLDPPPPDCEWVRYGPDLLLVNITTGEVIDTIYDAID